MASSTPRTHSFRIDLHRGVTDPLGASTPGNESRQVGPLWNVAAQSVFIRLSTGPRRRKSCTTRTCGSGLSQSEANWLLDACGEILLVSGDESSRVLAIHNAIWSPKHRKYDGVRRKFANFTTVEHQRLHLICPRCGS